MKNRKDITRSLKKVKDNEKLRLKKKRRLLGYLRELKNIVSITKQRKSLIENFHWEFENNNIELFINRDIKICKYIDSKRDYPSSFLGSSLGFTKMNFNQKYNEILSLYHLDRKPKVVSVRNSLAFENLKLLLILLYEKKQELQ